MVQTEDSSRTSFGNNSVTIPYPIPFYFSFDSDIKVTTKAADGMDTDLVLGTDYTLTGAGDPNGGSLKTLWPVPIDSTLTIFRDVPATQLTSYEEGDSFPAKSHEAALDKLTMLVQQMARATGSGAEGKGLAFRLSESSQPISPVARVDDAMLGIDALGNTILRTPENMLGWLGQVGTVWNDTMERTQTRGAFAGQLGVQLDNDTIYIANSTTPGDWLPFLLGTGIISAINGTPHVLPAPAGDLVGTNESQVLTNKTLVAPSITDPTGLDKQDVGLSSVDNTSDLGKPVSTAQQLALDNKQALSQKGVALGYPSLDSGGKIPIGQIPDAVIGTSQFQGTWNASTNTPAIPAAAAGNKGWYYSVAVAGTTNINGIASWAVGDQIISNGSVWQKIPSAAPVVSVAGKTGAVTLVSSDVGLGSVDNTSDVTKNAAAVTLTNKTINGANNTLTVRLSNDVTGNLPVARLNSGTGAAANTWWCGDGSWKTPAGTGDVAGPNGAGDGELVLYSGVTGKVIRRFSGTPGFAKLSATGVTSTVPDIQNTDLNPNVISAQPELVAPESSDFGLTLNHTTGLLAKSRIRACPKNYLSGFWHTATTDTTQVRVYSGICRDTTDQFDIRFPTNMVKNLTAWAPGNNAGGLDALPLTTGFYLIHAILNPATGASDILLSKSKDAPALPSGFTIFRRVGICYVQPTLKFYGHRFYQKEYFMWQPAQANFNDNTAIAGQGGGVAVSVPASLLGAGTIGVFGMQSYSSAGQGQFSVWSNYQPSAVRAVMSPSAGVMGSQLYVELAVDQNAQLSWQATYAAGGVLHMWIFCNGFYDDREKSGPGDAV